MVFIYTTCGDEAKARELAERIVTGRLAACVNIWRTGSIYEWEGALKEEKRVAMLIETNESKVQAIEDSILRDRADAAALVGVIDVRRVNREYKERMSIAVQ